MNGTPCHNALFAGKDTEFLIINKTHLLNTHQALISQMLKNKVIYIDVYNEPVKRYPLSYGDGPFLVDANALAPYFNEHDMSLTPNMSQGGDKALYLRMGMNIEGAARKEKLMAGAYKVLCRCPLLLKLAQKLKKAAGK